MLTCKQVSKALAEGDYLDLPPFQRFLLRLHVALCFICHHANRTIMVFQDMARVFRRREEDLDSGPKLPEDARLRILDAIREHGGDINTGSSDASDK